MAAAEHENALVINATPRPLEVFFVPDGITQDTIIDSLNQQLNLSLGTRDVLYWDMATGLARINFPAGAVPAQYIAVMFLKPLEHQQMQMPHYYVDLNHPQQQPGVGQQPMAANIAHHSQPPLHQQQQHNLGILPPQQQQHHPQPYLYLVQPAQQQQLEQPLQMQYYYGFVDPNHPQQPPLFGQPPMAANIAGQPGFGQPPMSANIAGYLQMAPPPLHQQPQQNIGILPSQQQQYQQHQQPYNVQPTQAAIQQQFAPTVAAADPVVGEQVGGNDAAQPPHQPLQQHSFDDSSPCGLFHIPISHCWDVPAVLKVLRNLELNQPEPGQPTWQRVEIPEKGPAVKFQFRRPENTKAAVNQLNATTIRKGRTRVTLRVELLIK